MLKQRPSTRQPMTSLYFDRDNDDDFPRSPSDVSTSGIGYQATPEYEPGPWVSGARYPVTRARERVIEDERERERKRQKERGKGRRRKADNVVRRAEREAKKAIIAARETRSQEGRESAQHVLYVEDYENSYDSDLSSSYEDDSDDLVPSDDASNERGPNLRTQRNRPGLAPIPPLRPQRGPTPQGTRAFVGLCNKDTISKDNTIGEEARMDDLMARVGRKMMRSPHFRKPQDKSADGSKDDEISEGVRVVRREANYQGKKNAEAHTTRLPRFSSPLPAPTDEATEDYSTEYDSTDVSDMDQDPQRRSAEVRMRENNKRIRRRIAEAQAKIASRPVAPAPLVPPRIRSRPVYGSRQDETESPVEVDYLPSRIPPWASDRILNTPSERYRQDREPDEHVSQYTVDGGRSRLKSSYSRTYGPSGAFSSYGERVLENPKTGYRENAYT